jgi:hypothetical protein
MASRVAAAARKRLKAALKARLAAIGWILDVRRSRTYVKEANPKT